VSRSQSCRRRRDVCTRIHTHTHTRTHARTHARTHTHTHKQTANEKDGSASSSVLRTPKCTHTHTYTHTQREKKMEAPTAAFCTRQNVCTHTHSHTHPQTAHTHSHTHPQTAKEKDGGTNSSVSRTPKCASASRGQPNSLRQELTLQNHCRGGLYSLFVVFFECVFASRGQPNFHCQELVLQGHCRGGAFGVYVRVCVCGPKCLWEWVCARACVSVSVGVGLCICICVFIRVCMYMCIYIRVCVHIYIYVDRALCCGKDLYIYIHANIHDEMFLFGWSGALRVATIPLNHSSIRLFISCSCTISPIDTAPSGKSARAVTHMYLYTLRIHLFFFEFMYRYTLCIRSLFFLIYSSFERYGVCLCVCLCVCVCIMEPFSKSARAITYMYIYRFESILSDFCL